MSRVILTLRHEDGSGAITELTWSDGVVAIGPTLERVKPNIERIIRNGLSESVGEGADKQLRTTSSSDPRFMERLAAYFQRQFNFTVELRDERTRETKEAGDEQDDVARGAFVVAAR